MVIDGQDHVAGIDNLEGRVLFLEWDIEDILEQPKQLEFSYVQGIQDEPYQIAVELVLKKYDWGMVDYGKEDLDPFDPG